MEGKYSEKKEKIQYQVAAINTAAQSYICFTQIYDQHIYLTYRTILYISAVTNNQTLFQGRNVN